MSKRGLHSETTPVKPSSAATAQTAHKVKMTDDNFIIVPTREEKKKQRKLEKSKPQFQYDIGWFRNGKKVGIAHIRDMLLYIVAEAQKPSWIIPEHKNSIAHTVVLFIPGLLPQHLGLAPLPITANLPFSTTPTDDNLNVSLPVIRQLFTYGCPTRAPGDQRRLHSVVGALLSSALPDDVRRRREAEAKRVAAVAKSDSASPLIYLLTPNQMLDNDYRLPSYISPSDTRTIPGLDRRKIHSELAMVLDHREGGGEIGAQPESYSMPGRNGATGPDGLPIKRNDEDEWVETPRAESSPKNGLYPILAMDCEMVVTEDGQELARVSIIDYNSGVNIYDKLVKPAKPVIDYRTQWSGITSEKLARATHTLSSVQVDLVTGPNPLFKPHTILLGHSLECDLTALKIRHPLCIDTAIIFKHPRGPPYKPGLKWLAQKWMNKEIQNSANGHDSEEDARTCVELLRLKMANGPEFGSFADTTESIFERMNRHADVLTKVSRKTAYCDYGNPRTGPGAKATTAVKCTSDDEVVDGMIKSVDDHDFVFGRMMELAHVQGWDNKHQTDHVSSFDSNAPTVESVTSALNDRLKRLHEALPSNSALVVLTGHGNPLPMLNLAAKRQTWERLVKTIGNFEDIPKEERWLSEHDRDLEKATAEAREGMAFFCVKR